MQRTIIAKELYAKAAQLPDPHESSTEPSAEPSAELSTEPSASPTQEPPA